MGGFEVYPNISSRHVCKAKLLRQEKMKMCDQPAEYSTANNAPLFLLLVIKYDNGCYKFLLLKMIWL